MNVIIVDHWSTLNQAHLSEGDTKKELKKHLKNWLSQEEKGNDVMRE